MISAFSSLISYKEDDWGEYLDRILLLSVFEDVIEAYPDKQRLKSVIRYIAYTYSVESDKIHIGVDWHQNKSDIYEFICAQQNKGLFDDLVNLQHPAVIRSVHKWLDWQNSDTHKTLCSLKDLKVEMQLSCNTPIRKANGEIDFSQKFLNAGYVKELTKMIKDLESELIQNNPKLKEAVKEVQQKSKEKNHVSPASYAL